ncbi:MAG: O-methyltransferase [Flavobacteriaceae bacterium]
MHFLPESLEQYMTAHSQDEPDLLCKLSRETHLKVVQPRMITGHYQGRVLSMFSKMLQPKYILEIGTYTGYSALCLAEGLQEGGNLHTIDINEELHDMQRRYFDQSPFGHRIVQYTGNAIEIIPQIELSFDLVFIDAEKTEYPDYLELVLEKTHSGSVILSDNVLWSGKVAEEPAKKDMATRKLQEYNTLLKEHPKLETVILPVRDGLSFSRVL